MNIHKLDWDSNFFGLRIGRADLQTKADAIELTAKHNTLKEEYDLLYVFDVNRVGFCVDNIKLIDEKVLYSKPCEHKQLFDDVILYNQSVPNESLYHLAHVSGEFSRFKLDKKFPLGSFEKMYNRWIENACPQKGTNKQIFIYGSSSIARGMISIDYTGDLTHIGLVSVDTDCQHIGIGSKIMSSVEEFLYRLGTIKTLEVPTQKANINACRWYEKNGFKVKSIVDIYHWWL